MRRHDTTAEVCCRFPLIFGADCGDDEAYGPAERSARGVAHDATLRAGWRARGGYARRLARLVWTSRAGNVMTPTSIRRMLPDIGHGR